MRLDSLSSAEAVSEVYASYQPKGYWPSGKPDPKKAPPKEAARMYCASCGQHNTLKQIEPDPETKKPRWECCSCGSINERVKWLREKGVITGSADISHADSDWGLLDAMVASRVISAVEGCDKAVKSWALWAHTDEATGADKYQLLIGVRDRFDAEYGATVRGLAHAIQVVTLIAAIVDDRKAGVVVRRGCKRLASVVGVDERQFKSGRSWSKVKAFIEEVLADYDAALDAAVSPVLKNVCKAPEETA